MDMDTIETFKPVYQRFFREWNDRLRFFVSHQTCLKAAFTTTPYWMEYYNSSKKSRHFKMRLMDSKEKTPCKHLFEDIIINPYAKSMPVVASVSAIYRR